MIESDLKAESSSSMTPYNEVLGDVKDKGIRLLVRERMLEQQSATYQPILSAVTTYKNAIAKTRSDHKKHCSLAGIRKRKPEADTFQPER